MLKRSSSKSKKTMEVIIFVNIIFVFQFLCEGQWVALYNPIFIGNHIKNLGTYLPNRCADNLFLGYDYLKYCFDFQHLYFFDNYLLLPEQRPLPCRHLLSRKLMPNDSQGARLQNPIPSLAPVTWKGWRRGWNFPVDKM